MRSTTGKGYRNVATLSPDNLQNVSTQTHEKKPLGEGPVVLAGHLAQFDFCCVFAFFFYCGLDQVFALDSQPHGDGGGHEYRGVDTEPDADSQGQREVMQGGATEEE